MENSIHQRRICLCAAAAHSEEKHRENEYETDIFLSDRPHAIFFLLPSSDESTCEIFLFVLYHMKNPRLFYRKKVSQTIENIFFHEKQLFLFFKNIMVIMKKNSFDPENQAGSERGTVMNRLFDTSVNVGLRQFYVLGAAGSIGNLFGFVGNVYIYGLSAPTIFCALCTLVIFGMTFWGIRSRHVKRAAYVIITLITFFEFPILYYIYQTGTIVYMVLAMVAIATFLPTTAAVIFGCLAFLVDMSAVILAYYHPVDVELVTAESELNSTVCSLMIVLFSVFTITIILNVQQKKQAEELTSLSRQLEQAADHDALTGLYNRRYLNRYLERLAQKGKKDVYAALIDLDFFKKVNDEYGHAFGDEVLIEFARILERNLIADGIAVRFGGEEFMLILPDVTEEEIRHMLAKMSADYRLFGKQKKNRAFTFSCGVEQFADGMDVSDVYRQADEKLYLAKERGRDRVIINR